MNIHTWSCLLTSFLILHSWLEECHLDVRKSSSQKGFYFGLTFCCSETACTPTSEKGLVSGSRPDMFYANTTISQVSLRIHSLVKNLPHDVRFLWVVPRRVVCMSCVCWMRDSHEVDAAGAGRRSDPDEAEAGGGQVTDVRRHHAAHKLSPELPVGHHPWQTHTWRQTCELKTSQLFVEINTIQAVRLQHGNKEGIALYLYVEARGHVSPSWGEMLCKLTISPSRASNVESFFSHSYVWHMIVKQMHKSCQWCVCATVPVTLLSENTKKKNRTSKYN